MGGKFKTLCQLEKALGHREAKALGPALRRWMGMDETCPSQLKGVGHPGTKSGRTGLLTLGHQGDR